MRGLFESKTGRLASFFCLYITEGIPLGFAATAIATQMRRQGVEPAQVSSFVGMLYLPWAWKWLIAPFVDIFYSDRLGKRRLWIVCCQIGMAATLLAGMPIDFASQLMLFTAVVILHNIFGATQDVAIDALACSTLTEGERGLANGMMFSGAYIGNAIGGSGVLFLTPYVGFNNTFYLVVGAIVLILVFVTLQIREPIEHRQPSRPQRDKLTAIADAFAQYFRELFTAFSGNPGARWSFYFAFLPCGSYALSLALQTTLSVELGLLDIEIAWLSLYSTVLAATGCVAGGLLSDRWGRRKMMALYIS